jgi:hypothetical protein
MQNDGALKTERKYAAGGQDSWTKDRETRGMTMRMEHANRSHQGDSRSSHRHHSLPRSHGYSMENVVRV